MKRLIPGIAAVIFAAAFAAFTTPTTQAPSLDDAYFAFDYANYAPTLSNVEDESKWVRVTDMNGCPGGEQRACKLRVSDSHYSGTTLLSTADILAAESASGIAYVDDAQAVQIVNRANP